MDPLTREIYEMRLKAAFRERGEGEFEDLFASIMERCHPGDFQRSTPWGRSGDRKNDGYLRSERRLFQCRPAFENRAVAGLARYLRLVWIWSN